MHRFSTFLSRSKTVPVEIHLRYLNGEDARDDAFVELICKHIEHCKHLSIINGDDSGLPTLLDCIAEKPAYLLRSVELSMDVLYNHFSIRQIPSPVDPAHLTSAILCDVDIPYLPALRPAIEHLTSLRVAAVPISEEEDLIFKETLMSMKNLTYLELDGELGNPPLILPSVRYLCISETIRVRAAPDRRAASRVVG